VEFLLVGYLLYSLTSNVYHRYQIDSYIEDFEAENAQIEEENRQKTEDYLYFTSEEYIDKIAKQSLGLVNPGEEVIILSPDILDDEIVLDEEELGDYAKYSGMSNPQQWWKFFFGS
jgi:cell division protein FtsB